MKGFRLMQPKNTGFTASKICIILLCCFFVSFEGVFSESSPSFDEIYFKPSKPDTSPVIPEVRTSHTGVFNGTKVSFDALAGETVLFAEKAKPVATIFSISYIRTDLQNDGSRPVLFLFNGGPGSSSSMLHLGVGPIRKAFSGSDDSIIIADGYCVLDAVDLVFIDPVGTGYSRYFEEGSGSKFWGIEEDADSIIQFMESWLESHNRQGSPIFILGESYGGMRATVILDRSKKLRFEGGLMISPSFERLSTSPVLGNNLPYIFWLPSMAVTSAFHEVTDLRGQTFDDLFNKAAIFAQTEYTEALGLGSALTQTQKRRIATKLERLTGLSRSYFINKNLRVSQEEFADELLKSKGLRTGRLDAQLTGDVNKYKDNRPPFNDPSMIYSESGKNDSELLEEYFKSLLNFQVDRPYRTLNLDANSKWNWQQNNRPPFVTVLPLLEKTMKENTELDLFVGGGLFDFAVPHMASTYLLGQMTVSQERITYKTYESGHSMYEDEPSREKLANDIRKFIQDSAYPAWVKTLEDRKLSSYLKTKRQEDITRIPELKTMLDINQDQDKWTSLADNKKEKEAALSQRRLEELRSTTDFSALSDEGKLNYELYLDVFESSILNWNYQKNTYAFTRSTFDPYLQKATFLIDRHRINTAEDAENYITRLSGIAELLEELKEATASRAEKGIILPAFNFDDISAASKTMASGKPCDRSDHQNRLWADFNKKMAAINITKDKEEYLLQKASRVLTEVFCPAYIEFAEIFEDWGKSVTKNDGLWSVPDGDKYYRMAIEIFIKRRMDPEEIHQIGLSEVSRIEEEILKIMEKNGFKGSVSDYFAHLNGMPTMTLPQTDTGRAAYIETATEYIKDMEKRLPDFFNVIPKKPVIARAVEKDRENYGMMPGAAFYTRPPLVGPEPGVFYSNLVRMDKQPLWALESVTYHESIPGHHMQVALTQENKSVPDFRRSYFFGGYNEGWALYAETLAKEMGAYPEGDHGNVGRLFWELKRAVRLVVDTGFHYKRWTIDQSAQYIADHFKASPESAMSEMERYANWPGQALSYKLGQLEFQRLRRQSEKELGNKFDIREFHSLILKDGVMPFDLLEQRVMNWIESK